MGELDLIALIASNATIIGLAVYIMRSWINSKFKDSELRTSALIKEKYRQSAKFYDDRYELVKQMFSLSSVCQDSINKITAEFSILNDEPSYESDKWASESIQLGEKLAESYSWDSLLYLLLEMETCECFVELRDKYNKGNSRINEAIHSKENITSILNLMREWQTETINQESKLRSLCLKNLGIE